MSLESDVKKFWSKINKTDSCWEWTGHLRKDGYATMSLDGKTILAHRISFMLSNGYLPAKGMVVDHLCGNRKCVNPSHLEEVTIGENVMRGNTLAAKNAAKTHCQMGHEYTQDNITMYSEGRRRCKICLLRRKRESYRRNVEHILEYKKNKYWEKKANNVK